MKAVVQSAFGPAHEVLSIAEIARPSIDAADVLVRVEAAGIAKGTWLMTHGLPYIARPSYGWRTPRERVAGLQFAGTVEAVGAEVDAIAPGDAVFGTHARALAELVAAPASALARKPDTIDFEQAAAAPIPGLAALQAVRNAGRVQAGQRVLVIGASGGVGSFTVQIARAYGASVTGVASTRNLEMVRGLGAERVIDYTREEIAAGPSLYDVIIDIAGNRRVAHLRRALQPEGTLVIVGGTGSRWTMGFERTIAGMLLSPFVRQRIVGLISTPNQADLQALATLMASGQVIPVVRHRVPLERTPEAIEAVGAGKGHGTLVVTL
jgi:NADPH:quinone reductase-like Zn-dependent oxidoreductase